jgi:hypothetical protein
MFIALYKGIPVGVPKTSPEAVTNCIPHRTRLQGNDENDYSVAKIVPLKKVTKTVTTWEEI